MSLARNRSAPCGHAAVTQLAEDAHVLELDLLARGARPLVDDGQPLEARFGKEHGASFLTQLALAESGVAVDVRGDRGLRVVDMQRPDPVGADDLDAAVERLGQALRGADVEPAG